MKIRMTSIAFFETWFEEAVTGFAWADTGGAAAAKT
jgi:hypothetical protein